MGNSMERELKLILEADEYERLCKHLEPFSDHESLQMNSYWDTPDRLLTARQVLLRLRIEDDRASLTSKGRAEIGADGVFESSEDELAVALDRAYQVLAGDLPLVDLDNPVLERLRSKLGELPVLECWGRMENLRKRFLMDDLQLEIDRTEFPGGVIEWELEVESDDPRRVAGRVHRLLAEVRIPVRPQSRTKSDRLRDRLT